jgi:hypothetical protein
MIEIIITHFIFVVVIMLIITAVALMGRAARDSKCDDPLGLTNNYGLAACCSFGLALIIIVSMIYIAVRALTAQ